MRRCFSPVPSSNVSMYYDVITRYRHRIALFPVLDRDMVCYFAYYEDDLAGESRCTRFWCQERDWADYEYLLNM